MFINVILVELNHRFIFFSVFSCSEVFVFDIEVVSLSPGFNVFFLVCCLLCNLCIGNPVCQMECFQNPDFIRQLTMSIKSISEEQNLKDDWTNPLLVTCKRTKQILLPV